MEKLNEDAPGEGNKILAQAYYLGKKWGVSAPDYQKSLKYAMLYAKLHPEDKNIWMIAGNAAIMIPEWYKGHQAFREAYACGYTLACGAIAYSAYNVGLEEKNAKHFYAAATWFFTAVAYFYGYIKQVSIML